MSPSTVKLSASSLCLSIYSFIISSVIAPTVAQKYPLAHKCWPQYLFLNCGYSSWSILELLPLRYWTIFAGARLGGHDTRIWIWSFATWPLIIVIPLLWHVCISNSFNRCLCHYSESYSDILLSTLCDTLYHILHGWNFDNPYFSPRTYLIKIMLEAYRLKVGGFRPGFWK